MRSVKTIRKNSFFCATAGIVIERYRDLSERVWKQWAMETVRPFGDCPIRYFPVENTVRAKNIRPRMKSYEHKSSVKNITNDGSLTRRENASVAYERQTDTTSLTRSRVPRVRSFAA